MLCLNIMYSDKILDSLEDYIIKYKIETNIYHKLPKICKLVKDLLNENNVKNDGEFYRVIGNAMRHGKCPLKCKIYIGRDKCLLIVKDSGPGFDYQEVMRKYNNGEIYYKHHGLGTETLLKSHYVKAKWISTGNKIILEYKRIDNEDISKEKQKWKYNSKKPCDCSKCKSITRRHIQSGVSP